MSRACGSRRGRRLASVLAALSVVLAAPPAAAGAWRSDLACGRALEAPRPATREGCSAAHCASVAAGAELCACRPAAGSEDGVRFTLSKDGVARQSWPAETMLGDTGSFRVSLADLDGDGRDELVIGSLTAVSNGMAVQYWSVCVIDGRDTSKAPSCVELDDYPFLGMLTRAPGERACRLLETHWRWGAEPKRGDGLYLVGRWLTYDHGSLRPDTKRPLVARRYLYRFAALRAEAIENARSAPILWLRDPTTRVVRCPDPLCAEPPAQK